MTNPTNLSGRELDEAVARVRGDDPVRITTYIHLPDGRYAKCPPRWQCEPDDELVGAQERGRLPKGEIHRQPRWPQYHKDDALAADLRSEMPRVHLVKGRMPDRPDLWECWALWEGDGRTHTTPKMAADTEATATARAYLKFKEMTR